MPQEAVESRPMVQVYGRKKALGCAASTLLAGVERLRASENLRNSRNTSDFHIELLRLRQNWRLKKVSNTIIGDLSYRTAGSKFPQSGVFEVNFIISYTLNLIVLVFFLSILYFIRLVKHPKTRFKIRLLQ